MRLFCPALALFFLAAASAQEGRFGRISAASLQEFVSYLASDALEGRATPSPGLERAADFIGQRFRQAGLSPAPGTGGTYFQSARFVEVTPGTGDPEIILRGAEGDLVAGPGVATVRARAALRLPMAPVVLLGELPSGGLEGRIVAAPAGRFPDPESLDALQALRPAAILLFTGRPPEPPAPYLEDADAPRAPVIRISSDAALDAVENGQPLSASVRAPAPVLRDLVLRNVAGFLRGSSEEAVLVTAHYDHLGRGPGGGVFPGANDNASGVASLAEIASALASLPEPPRRGVLFVAFFGEEAGLLGARYYVRHPLIPLSGTVADINLEQLGSTLDSDGDRTGSFAFTGPSYSNLPSLMAGAAAQEHVVVYRKRDGDSYFDRSDNYAFARAGVVAHTLIVAFEFPGYHQAADRAAALNFGNMASVDRGLAAGILAVANGAGKPKWSEAGRGASGVH